MRKKWVAQRRPSRFWVFPLRLVPRLLQCAAPPLPAPSGFGKPSLQLQRRGPCGQRPNLQVRSKAILPGRPLYSLTALASLRGTYPRGPFGPPALLPVWFAAWAAAGWLQRPRGLCDPNARAAKAPRVRPGLARAERAGPRSASLNAPQSWSRVASALAPGPAGPRSPGRAEVPPPGPYDGDLLGEKG